MKTLRQLLLIFSVTATLMGCAAKEEVPADSGFLSNYENLKEIDMVDGSFTKRYTAKKIQLSDYKKVFIKPIDYYPTEPVSEQMSQEVKDQVKDFIQEMMVNTFNQKYQIVNEAGPDTFILNAAITGLTIDEKRLSAYQYIPIAFLISAGAGALTDMSVKIQLEAEAVDSQSNEVIAAYTKREAGETLPNDHTQLVFSDLEPLLKKWSDTLNKFVNK